MNHSRNIRRSSDFTSHYSLYDPPRFYICRSTLKDRGHTFGSFQPLASPPAVARVRSLSRSKNLFESTLKVFATAAGAGARVHPAPILRDEEGRRGSGRKRTSVLSKRELFARVSPSARDGRVKKSEKKEGREEKVTVAEVCRELKSINRVSRVCESPVP